MIGVDLGGGGQRPSARPTWQGVLELAGQGDASSTFGYLEDILESNTPNQVLLVHGNFTGKSL